MDKDNRVELKPCPFCGCKELIISEYFPQENEVYTYFSKRYAIKCDYNEGGCGCESGHYKSLEEAISNWNSRSTEVCIDGGADVCEWRYVAINREYIPSCSNMRGLPSITGFKVCPYCTKPITIKGE